MRANTGMVSKQRGMDVGNGMAGNKQVSCEVVGDACSKLLSCDRELQTRARKTETSAGKYPSSQTTGTGGELDFTRRKETSQPQSKHRRHVAIQKESITQIQRQPCATTVRQFRLRHLTCRLSTFLTSHLLPPPNKARCTRTSSPAFGGQILEKVI